MLISESTLPPALPQTGQKPRASALAVLLSLLLAFFLISAGVSFLDDSLLAFFQVQHLTSLRLIILLLMLPVGFITYLVVAIAPGVPKRVFLTVALFVPVTMVAVLPLLVYFYSHAAWIGWGFSLLQLLAGWLMLRSLRPGQRMTWPLVPDSSIAEKPFRWGHFAALMVVWPIFIITAMLLCIGGTAKLAVNHFSDGFVVLDTSGVLMEVREYVRDDGKRVTLVPMSHVGESSFYEELSESFPDDSVVLMEGVSDRNKLLATTSTGYSKMAESIGVAEQQEVFKPKGELVAADMDMSDFSPATLEMLKTAMMIHSKGITPETMPILMKPSAPGLEKELMHDILTRRNHHLLKVLHERLPGAGHIIVPWGAAHMPEIAREIEKSGFRVTESKRYTALRFGS